MEFHYLQNISNVLYIEYKIMKQNSFLSLIKTVWPLME